MTLKKTKIDSMMVTVTEEMKMIVYRMTTSQLIQNTKRELFYHDTGNSLVLYKYEIEDRLSNPNLLSEKEKETLLSLLTTIKIIHPHWYW